MKRYRYLLVTTLIIVIATVSLIGCVNVKNQTAAKIQFKPVTDMNSMYLEQDGLNKMYFVSLGITEFVVLLPEFGDVTLKRSVDTLIKTVHDMSGATLTITNTLAGEKYIYITYTMDSEESIIKDDGFIIDISDKIIGIRANNYDGMRNGVYHFIEEYLGAMFITPDETFIPHHDNIYLTKGKQVFNPAASWRDVYSIETINNHWAAKLKLNAINITKTDEEIIAERIASGKDVNDENRHRHLIEGRQYNGYGTWCHSFYEFLSPEDYFETHPEYFSMYNGKRIHELVDRGGAKRQAHLCLSNPEVYDIVERELAKKIEEHPEIKYWDFSINDTYDVPGCGCKECKKLDKAAGGTGMGTLLPFVNKLAKRFPDKYISTLAYLHTLKAPKNIKAEENVVIKLCAMPGDQGTSYYNPGNYNAQVFHNSVEEWSKVADHIVIWDYVVDFANLLMPFPNFAVQLENQRFYEENNVDGIFHQASREVGGELGYLRSYVLSKLMWAGSNLDFAKEVSRFVMAYYGDAASDVLDYLNSLQANLSESTSNLGLYDQITPHLKGYLSHENITRYEKIINSAKLRVKSSPKYLKRVEELELNVLYAKMMLPKISETERKAVKSRVTELANDKGITMSQEWQTLTDFNKNLDGLVRDIKIEANKPVYIALGVLGGVIAITVILAIILIINNHNREKKNKLLDKTDLDSDGK